MAKALLDPILFLASDGSVLDANPPGAAILAGVVAAWRGCPLVALVVDDADRVSSYLRACVRSAETLPGALTFRAGDGQTARFRVAGASLAAASSDLPRLIMLRLTPLTGSAPSQFGVLNQKVEQLAREVMERRRAEMLLQHQKDVLELVTLDAPLPIVLDRLVRVVEEHATDGMLASILLLDQDGAHLRHGAAPSLPDAYNDAIDGVAIGPSVGSCGTAAYRREPVIVTDIATDPLWADFRALALGHGLAACWSTPILARSGRVLGTFAIYYREPRAPNGHHFQIIQLVTRTAALAIERKQAEEERARLLESERLARVEAEEANRLKDAFIATVSHELRTPLTSILGWAHLLHKRHEEPNLVAHAAEMILQSAKAQAVIVDDLLDISRIVTGKLRLNVATVDLGPIVDAALATVQPAAAAKSIQLQATPATAPILVWGDADRLQQVVWNLLSNAVKFTPAGGQVQVALSHHDGRAEIEVKDTGIGLRQEFIPHVFERFRQADDRIARHYGGLGLGLAIVRHLVELHGGEVRAASDGEGHGATFSVTLPVLSTVTPDLALAPGPSPTGGEASASSPLPPTTSSGE